MERILKSIRGRLKMVEKVRQRAFPRPLPLLRYLRYELEEALPHIPKRLKDLLARDLEALRVDLRAEGLRLDRHRHPIHLLAARIERVRFRALKVALPHLLRTPYNLKPLAPALVWLMKFEDIERGSSAFEVLQPQYATYPQHLEGAMDALAMMGKTGFKALMEVSRKAPREWMRRHAMKVLVGRVSEPEMDQIRKEIQEETGEVFSPFPLL